MTETLLLVDARCLQDPGLARRGVGSHASSLLETGRRLAKSTRPLRFVALTDRSLPPLAAYYRTLFDDEANHGYVPSAGRLLFMSLSPMTHPPLTVARLLQQPNVTTAAIV